MKMGRALRIGSLVVGIALGTAILSVVGWYLYSQMPSADARRLEALYESRQPVPDAGNAYLDVYGFEAPAKVDAHEHGARRVEWVALTRRDPETSRPDPADGDLEFLSARPRAAKLIDQACSDAAANSCAAAIASLGDQPLNPHEDLLLTRYETLLGRPDWFEKLLIIGTDPLPAYSGVMEAQRIRLIRLRQAVLRGDHAGVRDALERDLVFWRRMLLSADSLIAKMMAVGGIRRHFVLGNLVLRELPADRLMQSVPPSWLRPLSDEERSLWRVMAGEFAFSRAAMDRALDAGIPLSEEEDADDLPTRVLGGFLRRIGPPRMLNDHARLLVRVAEGFEVPLERYPQAQAALLAEKLSPQSGDMTQYAMRVGSVEGMRRAALLAARLHARAVPASQVETELARSDLRRPFDGKPFTWSAEGAIVHQGPEKKRDAIRLPY